MEKYFTQFQFTLSILQKFTGSGRTKNWNRNCISIENNRKIHCNRNKILNNVHLFAFWLYATTETLPPSIENTSKNIYTIPIYFNHPSKVHRIRHKSSNWSFLLPHKIPQGVPSQLHIGQSKKPPLFFTPKTKSIFNKPLTPPKVAFWKTLTPMPKRGVTPESIYVYIYLYLYSPPWEMRDL